MDITLTLNGRDFSSRVSTYEVKKRVENVKVITTMNGTEHPIQRIRDEIIFKLIPYDVLTETADYNSLKVLQFTAVYTDPNTGGSATRTVRLASDIDSIYGLKSVNGRAYYKGGNIVLRALEVNS